MPRISLSDEFKSAISNLNHKEKDRLLFRLLPKESLLVEQLTFKLLEHEATTEERRLKVQDKIERFMNQVMNRPHFSAGLLLFQLRTISSIITRHVRVTKDIYGEIELNLLFITTALKNHHHQITHSSHQKSYKLREYMIGRVLKLSKLALKLHEDYLIDFAESLQFIGKCWSEDSRAQSICLQMDLNIADLEAGQFPEIY